MRDLPVHNKSKADLHFNQKRYNEEDLLLI